jgi:hypothetical protein
MRRVRDFFQRIAAIAAMLIASPIAYAEPVHLTCNGEILTANKKILETNTKSLTVDLAAGQGMGGTVTFDGIGPLGVLPDLYHKDAETGRLVPDVIQPEDTVVFWGAEDLPVVSGTLNRITGQVGVQFQDGSFYAGTCKVSRRLF